MRKKQRGEETGNTAREILPATLAERQRTVERQKEQQKDRKNSRKTE